MRKLIFVILLVMIFVTIRPAYAEDVEVITIDIVSTPTPFEPMPTPSPSPTPEPDVIITKHDNDIQTVDIAARAAYYSPFDVLYWKFVYWCVMYNRTICNEMVKGVRLYSPIFIEVATNTDEFETWCAKIPNSTRGKEILHLNIIAANLFFDYIKSGGEGRIVPIDGVIIEYLKDENGLNRSANVYNLDGRQLELMSKEEFANTIGAEYYRRIGEQ